MWRYLVLPPQSRLLVLAPIFYLCLVQWFSSTPVQREALESAGIARAASAEVITSFSRTTVDLSHFPIFAVLGWLWCWSLRGWPLSVARCAAWAFALTIAFATISELSQRSVPGRSVDPADLRLNLGGALLGVGLYVVAALAVRPRVQAERVSGPG